MQRLAFVDYLRVIYKIRSGGHSAGCWNAEMVKSRAGRLTILLLTRKTESVTVSASPSTVRAEHQNWAVYVGLVFTMFIWGLAWPVGRLLAKDLPPVSIAAIRYAIVIPVLFAILWFREGSFKIERSWIPTLVVMGILNTTLYQIFFLYGVKYAAASDDSLVIGIGPVLIAIVASFALNPFMDQPLRLVLPNPTLDPRSTLDLQLGPGFMARNTIPRHPIHCSRVLPLHRRCLEDWSWQVRNLRQPRPRLRRPNFLSRPQRKPEPLDRRQLPTNTRGSTPSKPAIEELRFLSPFLILLTSTEYEESFLHWA